MSFATLLLLVAAPVILLGFLKNAPLFRGLAGERRVSRLLRRQLDQGSYQVIDNLLLAANNDTTQIDHVVVSVHGIFVLETKTFRGWIFGSERDRFWTQQIFAFRTRFQNPLRQNWKHLKFLEAVTGVGADKIYPVVVFAGTAELKTGLPGNVLSLRELADYIRHRDEVRLTPEEAARITAQLRRIRERTRLTDHIAHSYRLLQGERGAVPTALPSPARMALRLLWQNGLIGRALAALFLLVLLTVALLHPPRQLNRLLPPDGTQPPAILKRLDPRTTLRPAPPAEQRRPATGTDQVQPREATPFQGVIYSWTTKDGRRAYSNTGFPKDGDYFDAQIEYSQ